MEEIWKREWERARARIEERGRALQRADRQHRRITELQSRCEQLRREHELEQADVDKLQGLGFRALLRTLVGDKQEVLAKEEREAFEAKVRHRDACAEVERRRAALGELEAQATSLAGVEAELEQLRHRREQDIRQRGGPAAVELESLLDREDRLLSEQREIHEARMAGNDACEVLDEALELLDQAVHWGTYDMLGGGLVVTHIKHKKIDVARTLLEEAGSALWDFERELGDVTELEVPEIELGGLQVGLDYFLDGLLVDAFVQSRVNKARTHAESTRDHVEAILRDLDARHEGHEADLAAVRVRRDELLQSPE